MAARTGSPGHRSCPSADCKHNHVLAPTRDNTKFTQTLAGSHERQQDGASQPQRDCTATNRLAQRQLDNCLLPKLPNLAQPGLDTNFSPWRSSTRRMIQTHKGSTCGLQPTCEQLACSQREGDSSPLASPNPWAHTKMGLRVGGKILVRLGRKFTCLGGPP